MAAVLPERILSERVDSAIATSMRERARMRANVDELRDARAALAVARRRYRTLNLHRDGDVVQVRAQAEVTHVDLDAGLLTPRQLDILRRIASGRSTDAIADECWLTRTTVRNHVAAILRRLGAHSRIEAVARARDLGLL